MKINSLFDPTKDIYRVIEKVITYDASQEARLKSEISEYIVTDSIDDQFESLLGDMQIAMEMGGENDIGVWVSGFYGSGKSSFTKYLGLALDDSVKIDEVRFLEYLQNRMTKPQSKALLATIANRFPAAVILLDLASEMLAGATMEEVSTVLYYKVLQWAGYSRNLKVAALERRLKKDGRYQELTDQIQAELGVPWKDVQNDPLVIDSLIPEIAHQLYPDLFKTSHAFSTETVEFVRFEKERVKEMIDIVRESTDKEYIIFIIDEVGQYIASRPNLILNLDGLAKNLKSIGNGKVWIMATAQQTLTEDDPRAALNSPELYKLKDRFPIQIDLESKDIKEICYRRLLGKSIEGEQTLGTLFDKQGQELRFNTKLENAKYYDSDFNKTTFVNLYPFLPAHFDILLHLLGALAKSTGGIGLRSAIKVIQDILIEGSDSDIPVADRPVGSLANTVTLYDSLEKDIRRAAPSIHQAVEKTQIRFPDSSVHQDVSKTVAILQILGNMPVTIQNVTSLLHPSVEAQSRKEEVDAAIQELIGDGFVPFGEKDGNLCFFSERINDIDQERTQISLRSIETRRILNEAIRDTFNPLPSTRLNGTLSVTAGLKSASGTMLTSLAGERETIQIVVELVPAEDYENARTRLIDESRQRNSHYIIYSLGRSSNEIDDMVSEIYRSREIVQRYRNDPDQEVRDYCSTQIDRANKLADDQQRLITRCLSQGSFIFRGEVSAVESLDPVLLDAAKKHLSGIAGQVFDRYGEAPIRVETSLAERFLRTGNLRAISAQLDPLGLVQVVGGNPGIKSDHQALISIRDYIERNGSVDGKRVSDHFADAPFGWSPDTLRYLLAAMLVGGEIKLKISGREVTVKGQQAIDALRTNNAFKPVGVSLRAERPPAELLGRAAQRMTDLVGENVIPLEDEISKSATQHFPQFQLTYGSMANKLESLGLPGVDTIRSLNQELADILLTDASDVPQRLGAEESHLYTSLIWGAEVDRALKSGLEKTISNLREHWKEINALPDYGTPGQLKANVDEALQQISERLEQENFYAHSADLNSTLTAITTFVRDAVIQMTEDLRNTVKTGQQELQQLYEWSELTNEEQSQALAQLDALMLEVAGDLSGLKHLLAQEYNIQFQITTLKSEITELGHKRKLDRSMQVKNGDKYTHILNIPTRLTSTSQLEELILKLHELKNEIAVYGDIEVKIELKD